jgi:hypothetical protein
VVDRVRAIAPVVYVVLDDWNADVAANLGDPAATVGTFRVWMLSSTSPAELTRELYRGAWAMIFFRWSPPAPPAFSEVLPRDPGQLVRMVEEMGAFAAIVSWFDDLEWMVAFAAD